MLHLLAGDAVGDFDAVLKAGKSRKLLPWRVPKNSHANDSALFYLPNHGFSARGVIGSEPREYEKGRYTAKIRDVTLLPSAVPLAFVKKYHPTWKWLRAQIKLYDSGWFD